MAPTDGQWQSGLLPYPVLLAAQLIVLTLMVRISVDVWRGAGPFISPPRPLVGRALVWFSIVYIAGMILRYAIRMHRRPDQRWVGGTIPIIFHSVVAVFLFTFGPLPPRRAAMSDAGSRASRAMLRSPPLAS